MLTTPVDSEKCLKTPKW